MIKARSCIGFALLVVLPAGALLNSALAMDVTDGVPACVENGQLPSNIFYGTDDKTIDIIGDASNSSSGVGRAKGNSYQVDMDVILNEAEFWLDFSDTQTLTYYVFDCPDEFGTYTEVYRNSEVVAGIGVEWYSSGSLSIPLTAGTHYIIAVSWDGDVGYFYGTGESQVTSFGSQTHGYATGYDPLPGSFDSLVNDTAIYHQRLDTVEDTSLEMTTWGAIKAAQ